MSMFGNIAKQNNFGQPSVNTSIKYFYSDLSSLSLSYWNQNLSIKINPLQAINEDGRRVYDYSRRVGTALTPEKCLALSLEIEKKILPAIEKVQNGETLEEPINVGVPVGNAGTALFLEYKTTDEVPEPTLYLIFYTNIQENKANPEYAFTYKFGKITVIEGYDPISGEAKEVPVEAEFMYLYDKMRNIQEIAGTAAHSENVNNAFKAMRTNPNNQSPISAMTQQSEQPQQSYSAPTSTFNDNDFPF